MFVDYKMHEILGDNSCILELEPSNLIIQFNFETHWSMHRIFVQKLNVKLDYLVLISLYVSYSRRIVFIRMKCFFFSKVTFEIEFSEVCSSLQTRR